MSIKNTENIQFLERLAQERANSVVQSSDELDGELAKLDIEDRLFVAILLNSKETVAHLLEVGADPNATNKKGTSILQLALAFERADIAHLLLDHGALPTLSSLIKKNPKTKF